MHKHPCRTGLRGLLLLSIIVSRSAAQELQPRAYVPAPEGLNYFGVSYANNSGGLLSDSSSPVQDVHADANIVSLLFGQTLNVLGRTAQILAVLPYAVANLSGRVGQANDSLYRSGVADSTFRYAMNLYGAPAMNVKEFMDYHQGTIIGASLTVTVPSGQYDPNKLINISANHWEFKPELGVSRAIGKWTVEGAAGVWLFTTNHQYYGKNVSIQAPLGSFQTHVVRYLPHRIWLSFDGTFFAGGRTQIDAIDQPDYQSNTRGGVTLGIGLTPRQAIKVSYFNGVTTRNGADVRSLGISYNIVWLKGRMP
jgi:hypothetical protein